MQRDRYQNLLKPIGWLYALAFFLPVGGVGFPGILCFLYAGLFGLLSLNPALLIGCAANPFALVGMMALEQKRFDRALRFGLLAFVSSLAPALFVIGSIQQILASDGLIGLWKMAGYFGWSGSFFCLALVGFSAVNTDNSGKIRFSFNVSRLLIVIACIAVPLAFWRHLLVFLYSSISSSGGFPTPG